MEITRTQKQLTALLKALNLKMEQVIGVMLALQKEEQQLEMMNYIIENKDTITEDMISEQLLEILDKN